MDPQKIIELANLLRNNGDKILNSEFTLTLSGALLRALNDSFTLIADNSEIIKPHASSSSHAADSFEVVKPIASKSPVFRDLQLVHDFVQKTALLCIVHYAAEEYFEGRIDIGKFRALRRLEVQKTNVRQIVGIQRLRAQLQQLICVRSLHNGVEDIITRCGGDNSNGFVWNELKVADFSYNNLKTVDSSLEFAQFLQHLNLRHNQLHSVEAIKWLPHLKTLDLSYNKLPCIPQFHVEACKRLQSLNMGNNFVEDLMGLARLDALTDLDLCDNCLLDHSVLLPLSALVTLRFLNLYGNPLHYHPKHRLATAQFLHKNTASVKFILDFDTLSKSERALTGSQQLRHVGSLNRYATKSSAASISGGGLTPNSSHTPASSVGSLRSFKFQESASVTDMSAPAVVVESATSSRKRVSKMRTVEFDEEDQKAPTTFTKTNKTLEAEDTDSSQAASVVATAQNSIIKPSVLSESTSANTDHLETKRNIQLLREKYGAEWLQSGNAEMMQSVLGIIEPTNASNQKFIDQERNASRQLFNDFLGEFSASASISQTEQIEPNNDQTINSTVRSSTPTDTAHKHDTSQFEENITPIKSNNDNNNSTFYESITNTTGSNSANAATSNQSLFQSADESSVSEKSKELDEPAVDDDIEAPHLKHVYSIAPDEEPEFSETEDDEVTYIVYTENQSEAIFLTLSSNFLRERDTLTQRTKTKWSLKILESCDRIKSKTIRINFDTVKVDKQERVYIVTDDLCQELERKLRDILSQRDFSEMNQTIYRCVNCACQFSIENKNKPQQIRCPDCKSTFIAEIHDIPKSLDKFKSIDSELKLSPAAIVEESPISTPLVIGPPLLLSTSSVRETDNTSIGSANSLNESSSCSKITNSQSSFDSNQSVVGSSNTDRDNDFKSNCESDVEILSNPSQSSIEVLDHSSHQSSRKTSEERRISHIPNLETIDDHSYKQNSFIEREFAAFAEPYNSAQPKLETVVDVSKQSPTKVTAKTAPSTSAALAHFNLTESSSSGSVTDSVCTAYEQQAAAATADKDNVSLPDQQKNVIQNLLSSEVGSQVSSNSNSSSPNSLKTKDKDVNGAVKKDDSGISSMFGALFQSTNILMSSSKKLIDAEANVQTGAAITSSPSSMTCLPYKFNYTDFRDVDHRLKLYFYQTKFEEEGEHFKWLARGRIYNEVTRSLFDGLLVMSTCKCYLMEAYAPEHDDVTKWLRQVVSVTVDRLECIQLLPWKMGLAFELRDWGGFLLLLQDILRTDSLLLYFANNSLPSQCELKYQPAEQITKRLGVAVVDEKLNMCSLLNACEISCENAKRTFATCGLLTTNNRLYLTSGKVDWLSAKTAPNAAEHENEIQLCVTQFMSNLVEVERPADNVFAINFLDETQDKCELWKCTFETKENADSCLNAIGQSWELLFGVPLFNA